MLDNFDKTNNSFKVPENYFENFNNSIMDKLPAKENAGVKRFPMWKKALSWTAAAAVFFGVIFTTGILDSEKPMTHNIGISTNTSGSLEDDYYSFLEDEVTSSQFNDMISNF